MHLQLRTLSEQLQVLSSARLLSRLCFLAQLQGGLQFALPLHYWQVDSSVVTCKASVLLKSTDVAFRKAPCCQRKSLKL